MAKSGLKGLNWIGIIQIASLVLTSYNRLVGIVACVFWIIDLVTVIVNKEVTVLA